MRKVATALLGLPAVGLAYLAAGRRRTPLPALVVGLMVVAVLVLGAAGIPGPAGTAALPPSTPGPMLDAALATRIETSPSPSAGIVLRFPAPMNVASVAALMEVDPPAPVHLDWAADATVLTVEPLGTWAPGVLHVISIDGAALDATGRPIVNAIRAVFVTRPATVAVIEATDTSEAGAALGTAFLVRFDRPVDASTLSLVSDPPIPGGLAPAPDADGGGWVYRFRPDLPLAPGTTYRLALAEGALDADGAPIVGEPLVIEAAPQPSVVRFRPRDGSTGASLSATLSVRFTEPMDELATSTAWTVTVDGSAVDGKISFAEDDTVLVFVPASSFGYDQKVVMTVGAGALSRAGVGMAGAVSGTFTTASKPATPKPSTSGGGSVGAGTWAAVETYYLKLMNCTRTGGWVQSNGSCVGYGSGSTAPLWIDQGISTKVSRPYAKLEAQTNQCSHFIGGTPGDRLSAAGYTSYIWAENLGCRDSSSPYSSVLGSHLYFQSEKPYNGGHYVNMMNPKYDRVGLGVWVVGNRVRLVVDFYHPR